VFRLPSTDLIADFFVHDLVFENRRNPVKAVTLSRSRIPDRTRIACRHSRPIWCAVRWP
jgi:hypothetical protein